MRLCTGWTGEVAVEPFPGRGPVRAFLDRTVKHDEPRDDKCDGSELQRVNALPIPLSAYLAKMELWSLASPPVWNWVITIKSS
jgi:hypothetical protein